MTGPVKVCLIAARGRNNVIGREGDLPWRLKDDLAFFKKTTLGSPIVMGRKTWESLPVRPLKGRENIVLTRDWTYAANGARVYSSFAAAINTARAIARRQDADTVYVIGGVAIFEAALPFADRIYMTEVDAAPEGDVYFPDMAEGEWTRSVIESHAAGGGNDHAFEIVQLDRIPAAAPH